MKGLAEWSGLALYLGVGIMLGCTIVLAKDFDIAMAVGGGVAIVGALLHTFAKWRMGLLFNKDKDVWRE